MLHKISRERYDISRTCRRVGREHGTEIALTAFDYVCRRKFVQSTVQ
jgi:hypothetical protein